MSNNYILSCESTVDVPYTFLEKRNIPVLFYTYNIDGETFVDDMGRDPEALPKFYNAIAQGKMPKTSQINTFDYCEFFEGFLKEGKDILHIAFSSGMSNSVNNAMAAVEMMKEKYPDRTIIVVDSLAGSSGYGLLVATACELRDKGYSIIELANWTIENRHYLHHQFYATDLKHFRRGGRVSGPTATIGTILSICPIMHLNEKGSIIAYEKARGKKNAIIKTLDEMEKTIPEGRAYKGKCYLSYSNCPEMAEDTRKAIMDRFPHIDGGVQMFNIGTIIGSHTGTGTVAIFYFGEKVKPDDL